MPRERLTIGSIGNISTRHLGQKKYQAIARIRDKDGVIRQIKTTDTTRGKAEQRLRARIADRVPPSSGELTSETPLRVAAEKWLAQVAVSGVKYSTARNYRNVTRLHIVPLIGALSLREVTASQVRDFVATVTTPRLAGGVEVGGPTTARHSKVALSQIMGMCVLDGAISHNPVDGVKTKKAPARQVKALSVAEIQSIREAVREWGKVRTSGPARNAPLLLDFLDVLAGTGCRPGEVLAMRWEDVDFKAGTMRVTGTVVQTDRGVIRQETPKTETSQRWFTLPAFVVQVLRLRYMRTEFKKGPVFATRNGTYYQDSNIHRIWRQARGEAWKHVSFAHYRKAVATLIERAEGVDAAAGQLGHSSPEVTRRYYIEREGMVDFSRIVEAFGPGA